MSGAVIIYGPQGSGKTTNARKLAKHYGKRRIIEEWSGDPRELRNDALYLTNDPTEGAIHIEDALRAAGLPPFKGGTA